jgi:hypothetical protein
MNIVDEIWKLIVDLIEFVAGLIGVFTYYGVIWGVIYAPILFGPLMFLHNNIDLSKGKFALVSILYLIIVAIRVVIPLRSKINGWMKSYFDVDVSFEKETGNFGCLILFLGVAVYLLGLLGFLIYKEW